MRTRVRALLACSSCLLLAGCEVTATQLVVWVDTDMALGDELTGFEVLVRGPDGERAVGPFPVGDGAPTTLPASFGVAPEDGDASRSVEVAVAALTDEDFGGFETRARTTFLDHERLRLDLFLARRCQTDAAGCEEQGLTCTRDGCVDPVVEPRDLRVPPQTAPPPPAPARWALGFASAILDGSGVPSVDMAVDAAGNVYVTAPFDGTVELGGTVHDSLPGGPDSFVLSVTADGAFRWAALLRAGARAGARTRAIAVDRQGTAWVVLDATGDTDVAGRVVEVSKVGSVLVVALGPEGRLAADPVLLAGDDATATDVAVGDGGEVGVIGQFTGELGLDIPYVGTNYGVFAARLDAAGSVVDSCAASSPAALYARGTAFVAGGLHLLGSGYADIYTDLLGMTCAGGRNVLLLDCSGHALGGLTCFGGASWDDMFGAGLARGPDGQEAVAASFGSELIVDGAARPELAQGGLDGLLVTRAGDALQWIRTVGGPGDDTLDAVAIGADGTVAVGGQQQVDLDRQAVVAVYGPAGELSFSETFGGPGDERIFAVAVDAPGRAVVVAGEATARLEIDGTTVLGDDGGVFVRRLVLDDP